MPSPPPSLEDQMCAECRYFISDGNNTTGECHRHPPVRDAGLTFGVWPTVAPYNWCGEFVASPDDGGEQ